MTDSEIVKAFSFADFCCRCRKMYRHKDLVLMIQDGAMARFICKGCETDEDVVILVGEFLYEKNARV